MKQETKKFNNATIRCAYDADTGLTYYSIVDVIAAITEVKSPKRKWSATKKQLSINSVQPSIFSGQLKITADDGKQRLTDVATMEEILNLLPYIKSNQTDKFKEWLYSSKNTTKLQEPKNSAYLPQISAIQNHIYYIRNRFVMLDFDIANLYNVGTRDLNKAMKRNKERFPESFCFSLTHQELTNLKFQIGTSSLGSNMYGGRRKLPFVYTEQGVAMLSTVLRSDKAVEVSIQIMDAFVQMKHNQYQYHLSTEHLSSEISKVKLQLIEYQAKTDDRFEEIFSLFQDTPEIYSKIFFQGEVFDALVVLKKIIESTTTSIILIDNYVNTDSLEILSKKKENVSVDIYTHPKTSLSEIDITKFNLQYPLLQLHTSEEFHDRFLIIDNKTLYHVDSSIKDAGKTFFAISEINDEKVVDSLLERINKTST